MSISLLPKLALAIAAIAFTPAYADDPSQPQAESHAEAKPSSGPTAADLLRTCMSNVEGGQIHDPTCQGYMAGYIGAIRVSEPGPDEGSDYPICLPDGSITNRDLVAGLSAVILSKPESADHPARDVMFEMLVAKAPCEPKAPAKQSQTDLPSEPRRPAMIQPR